jgi:hypothetical protein
MRIISTEGGGGVFYSGKLYLRIVKIERLPWGTMLVREAAEKRRGSMCSLSTGLHSEESCICTGYELESELEIVGKRATL